MTFSKINKKDKPKSSKIPKLIKAPKSPLWGLKRGVNCMKKPLIRRSIKSEFLVKGAGLHSGNPVALKMLPALPGTGIQFTNEAEHKGEVICATIENVVDTSLAVTLGNDKWRIQTVEHLLSAISMSGISDLVLDINSEEVPILDGSAEPFCKIIKEVGLVEYNDHLIDPIEIRNPVWVVDGDKYIIALPAKEFQVTYNVHYNHPLLRGQNYSSVFSNGQFQREIAGARTFGFIAEVDYLRSRGYAKGGSIENAVVLDDKGYLNPSLRFDDECVRHKVLDLIGDLALLGRPIKAHLIANKAGHALDVALAKKVSKILNEDEIQPKRLKGLSKFFPRDKFLLKGRINRK